TDDQKAVVAELVSAREKQLKVASTNQKNTLLSYYATKLSQVLTEEQRTKWEQMGGHPAPSPVKLKGALVPLPNAVVIPGVPAIPPVEPIKPEPAEQPATPATSLVPVQPELSK